MGRGCLLALPAAAIAAVAGYILGFIAMTSVVPTPAWDMEGSWAIGIMFFIAPLAAIAVGSGAALVVGLRTFLRPGASVSPAGFALFLFVAAGMTGWFGCLTLYQAAQAYAPARGVEVWPALVQLAPFVGIGLGLAAALVALLRRPAEEG